MRLTAKQRFTISQNLKAIAEGYFDEKHLKDLLVDIREFVSSNSFVRELGHFMAHYERNSGRYHALFNLREATLSLVEEDPVTGNVYVNIDFKLLSQPIYETVFIAGVKQYFDNRVKHGIYAWSEGNNPIMSDINTVNMFIKNCYIKTGKKYELRSESSLPILKEIAFLSLGTFNTHPLISQDELIIKLNDEIKHFCKSHIPNINFGNEIKRRASDITMCIMSLLQNATFVLFDNKIAQFELRITHSIMRAATLEQIATGKTYLSVVGGRVKENGGISGPNLFIGSNLEPKDSIINITEDQLSPTLPVLYTVRDAEGNLKLTPFLS